MRGLVNSISSSYINRCHRTLKEWGAPMDGWYCEYVIDWVEEGETEGLFTCELCGCTRVRFVHVMKNDDFYELISVGCICAGIMEKDVLAAKERERLIKNRAKRRKNFVGRKWEQTRNDGFRTKYQGEWVTIISQSMNSKKFIAEYDGRYTDRYKGKHIMDFCSAAYAAFDLADPIEKVWNA